MHTFTSDANTLRDRASGIACVPGMTRLLPILSATAKQAGVRVVIYIGGVFEGERVAGPPAGGRDGRCRCQLDRAA